MITGKTLLLHEEGLRRLTEDNRVILAGKEEERKRVPDKVKQYKLNPTDDGFGSLFDVYSFQTVFFFSGYVDGGSGIFGENRELERTLDLCSQFGVARMVFLTSYDSLNYTSVYEGDVLVPEKRYQDTRALEIGQLEEYCSFLSKSRHQKLIILRVPYLGGEDNSNLYLGKIFESLKRKENINLPYGGNAFIDFVGESDLTGLMLRITEEEEEESGIYNVSSGYKHTWEEFSMILKKLNPEITIHTQNSLESPGYGAYPDYPEQLRRIYGWIPVEDVIDGLFASYNLFQEKLNNGKKRRGKLLSGLFEQDGRLVKYTELLVGFLVTEFLNHYISSSLYFDSIDIRLFFVVIMGTVYGIRLGLLSAVLASFSLFMHYQRIGVDWTLLFYNVENWIPFMIYLTAGSVTGYVKNKKTEEIKFVKEEYDLLRDKYLFLNEVYKGAIENKGEYKKQILGFKDSFGRIFDAVQKLDNILPQSVFMEALDVMEDIMENRTIAIYSVDGYERFGRLVVCSSSLSTSLKKSLMLSEYPQMFQDVKSGKVWKNETFIPNCPVYANGIFRDGHLVMFVCLYEAQVQQYGMDYMNIFRILCGLVQTSFLRALEYMEAAEAKIYYEDTNVMKPDKFREILNVQKEMKEKKVADYILLQLDKVDRKQASGVLSQVIRNTDTIGEGNDGKLYLLLTQVNEESFHFVEERLKKTGVVYKLVGKAG